MKWYVVSRYYSNGLIEGKIFADDEIKNTTGYIELEEYDRYVDQFDSIQEAMQFMYENDIKEVQQWIL